MSHGCMTRQAMTQIVRRTGQTVVNGGLMERQTSRTRSGIQHVKDIQLLCYSFGATRERVTNSELFLFLTPFVVASDEDADRLGERGILYAPDFVVNAGGIINIAAEVDGYSTEKANAMVDRIYDNLTEVLRASDSLGISTEAAAEHVAESRIEAAGNQGDES